MKTIFIKGVSKKGLRGMQQDRFAHIKIGDCVVLAVTDGNGGEGGGEIADAALKSIASSVCLYFAQGENVDSSEELKSMGLDAINSAVKTSVRLKKKHKEWVDAGTTVTLVVVTSWLVGVFWIGDSPAYLFVDGELEQLTKPHTHYEKLLKEGRTKESLEQQPELKSVLTQCIARTICQPDSKVIPYQDAITVLVGSDGVFSYLSEQEIKDMLQCFPNQDISQALVQKAIDNFSDDNLTIVASSIVSRRKPTRTLFDDYYVCDCQKQNQEG